MDACDAAGVSNYPFMDLYNTLFKYSLQYGYDERNGGFYYTGTFRSPADDRSKSWWVQAEVIVSALRMYNYTKDPKYLAVFESTFNFIEKNMVDWETGEWHSTVTAAGSGPGRQGQPLEGRLSQRPVHDRMPGDPQGVEELTRHEKEWRDV